MRTVASADQTLLPGNLLYRSGNAAFNYTLGHASANQVSSQAMLRPFHCLEDQCRAERRRKAERCRDASSKAGFLGQLRQLNFVQQRLQSMHPAAEPPSPEALVDPDGERWSRLPGSAPPLLSCRPALASNASPQGPGHGSPWSIARGHKGARRRRPVHVISSSFVDDDPALIRFSEEPEDPRVHLPAHRIGDLLPEVQKVPQQQKQHSRFGKPGISKSMPSLHIAARRLSLRPVRGTGQGANACAGIPKPKLAPRQGEDFREVAFSRDFDPRDLDDDGFLEDIVDFTDDTDGDFPD